MIGKLIYPTIIFSIVCGALSTKAFNSKNLYNYNYCNVDFTVYVEAYPEMVSNINNLIISNPKWGNCKFKLKYLTLTVFITKNFIKNILIKEKQLGLTTTEIKIAVKFYYHRQKHHAKLQKISHYMFVLVISF